MATGCQQTVAHDDEIFYRGPGRRVLCAATIDSSAGTDFASIETGLDRARDDGLVLQLYGHRPGVSSSLARIEAIAKGARDRGLTSFTYDQLAQGVAAGPGLALSFDDDEVETWSAMAEVIAPYDLRVTFFVSRFQSLTGEQRAQLHDLARRGHDIEAHSVEHRRGPEVVEERGIDRYLSEEVMPSVDRLVAEGFSPQVFAYPFGARTTEIDDAVLGRLPLVRSVSYLADNFLIVDPCPE